MKNDITGRPDIEILVKTFYDKVNRDNLIADFFGGVNWEKHLPVMYNFWSDILFGETSFKGNPMLKHMALNSRMPMETVHFERWLTLFNQTVDELFEGQNAELIKQRALSIATVMRIKIAETKG
jgi:hemoglobin